MLIEATNPFKCDRAIAMTKERTCCNAAMSEKRCATIREMKEGPFEVGNQVLISSHRKNPMFNGRRQSSRGGTSWMTRECQVRFCERLGGEIPRAYSALASKAAEAVRPCTSAAPRKADVNSPPWLPPLSAKTGLMHCSKTHWQLARDGHRETQRLSSFRLITSSKRVV